jgi:hypothetical protein
MSTIRFEWDQKEAELNVRKRNVSFEDAQSVFSDERALLIDDPDHSEDEADLCFSVSDHFCTQGRCR